MADSNLQILISAVDEASDNLQKVGASLQQMAGTADSAASETNTATEGIGSSFMTMVDNANDASQQVAVAMGAIALAVIAAGTYIGKQAIDQQASAEVLSTTTKDSIDVVDQAAKGQGAFADELKSAKSQVDIARDAMIKLEESTKKGANGVQASADAVEAAQIKLGVAEAKYQVLQGRMDDVGKSAAQLTAAQQPLIDQGVNLGFGVDDVTKSLNILEPMMGSKLAATTLTAAENLSRASDGTLDLASAAKILGSAMETGMGKGLVAYGINVKDGIGGTTLLALALQQTKDQAANFAETTQGKLDIAWSKFNQDMGESGKVVLPLVNVVLTGLITVIDKLMSMIPSLVTFFEKYWEVALLVAGAIVGALTPAIITFGITLITVTIPAIAAAAIALAPFIIGGIIIAGVVAGILWIVTNWKDFTEFFQKAYQDYIVPTGKLLKEIVQDIETTWHDSWTNVGNLIDAIWTSIKNTIRSGVNSVISDINALISGLDSLKINIPAISIAGMKTPAVNLSFNIPEIPMLAAGGIVTAPMLAMIGEGGPEAVVPLSQMNSMGGNGMGTGNPIINITINGGQFTDPNSTRKLFNEMAKQINQKLKLRTV